MFYYNILLLYFNVLIYNSYFYLVSDYTIPNFVKFISQLSEKVSFNELYLNYLHIYF